MNTPTTKRFKAHRDHAQKPIPALRRTLDVPPKTLRLQLGLTQTDFWSPVGVSQSGGSRYESGRRLPVSTGALLHLVHIEGIDLNQLNGDDSRVGHYLRVNDPETYSTLLKAAAIPDGD